MDYLVLVKESVFTYWEWLVLALSIITVLQFRIVHNLVMLSLWPARYPLLAVIYIFIFMLYLLAKALDPRAADLMFIHMTKGREESFPLTRFLKGLYLSFYYRRMSMSDFPVYREQAELIAVVDTVNGGAGAGTLESRLRRYVNEKDRLDRFIKERVKWVKMKE